MTIEQELSRPHRLYNAGDRITEQLIYSIETGHDIHCVARWPLDAPSKEFFTVPRELRLQNERITVHFIETLLRDDRYGTRGVIMVDPDWQPPADEEEAEKIPLASSDKEAIAKGDRMWKRYMLSIAQMHIDQCNVIRSRGGVPLAAQGFTKRCLRECGWEDPAEAVLLAAQKNKSESADVEALKQQVAEQQELLNKLLAAQDAKPKQQRAAR